MTAPSQAKRRPRALAFVALTKPRIIELLLVETVPVMIVADKGVPSIWLILATVIGGTLAAGGANAFNMYFDRDIDRLMDRTKGRPMVTGEISPGECMVFAFALEAVSFAWMWGFVNLLSAVLVVSATLFYVIVYTLWLKRTSTRNIVIGGAAGAVPVLVGWTAVTNSLDWPPVILFLIVFYWTPPHFWALAIRYREDYQAADVPMLPSVASMKVVTGRILGYTIVLWAFTLLFAPVAGMGWIYLTSAVLLGASFTWFAVGVRRSPEPAQAMRLFGWSITYLVLLFGAMAVDQIVRTGV